MDLRMPDVDGLTATGRITGDPALASVRVVVLTTFDDDESVFAALRAGASGFLVKDVEPADLLQAVRVVARGDALLSPSVTRAVIGAFTAATAGRTRPRGRSPGRAAGRLAALTDREREVVCLVAAGLSNDEIATKLMVSPLTVKTHVSRAMTKLLPATGRSSWSSPSSTAWPSPPAVPSGGGQGPDIGWRVGCRERGRRSRPAATRRAAAPPSRYRPETRPCSSRACSASRAGSWPSRRSADRHPQRQHPKRQYMPRQGPQCPPPRAVGHRSPPGCRERAACPVLPVSAPSWAQ